MGYRIRTVKPEAWQSEQICAVSRDARCLWLVLITMSDDDGRFRWRPATVLGHGFPADDDAPGLLDGWLEELVREGLVVLYENGRSQFGAHPSWRNHQRINKPTPSTLPSPNDPDSRAFLPLSVNGHVVLPERSGSELTTVDTPLPDDYTREGIGGEGSGEEGMAATRTREREADAWWATALDIGQRKRLPWASAIELLGEQRQRCEALFADVDQETAKRVRREVLDKLRAGKIRNQLPDAVRAFIAQDERSGSRRSSADDDYDAAADLLRRTLEEGDPDAR